MQVGTGIKADKAEKVIGKYAGDLVEGEDVWFYAKCNNFRPMVNTIVITNVRVLGLAANEGYKYKAPVRDIVSAEFHPKKKTVHIVTTDGQEMIFKSVPSEDVPSVEHYLNYARTNPAPPAVVEALVARGSAATSVLAAAGETKDDFKAAKKQQKVRAKADQQAAEEALAGRQVASEVFGGKTVKIYQKGYVRVGMFGKGPLEQLTSIEASSDVTKKTGVGRTAMAAMTLGANLATSNKRGDVYLTIVTDRTTHVLHEDPPTDRNLKASKTLEGAGRGVLQTQPDPLADAYSAPPAADSGHPAGNAPQVASPVPGAGSLADKLRELSAMRDDGLISAEEYESMRAKLLEAF